MSQDSIFMGKTGHVDHLLVLYMHLFFYDVIYRCVFDFNSLLIFFFFFTLIEVVLSMFHTLFTYFSKLSKMRFLVSIFCTICTFHCSKNI